MSPEFNARLSALRRHYVYRIGTAAWGVPPLRARDTVHHPPRSGRPLDVDAMNHASTQLLGLRDFAAYCRARPDATTVRELQRFRWTAQNDDVLIAEVSADAFCWSMVRSLVGALLAVGDGQRDIDWPFQVLSTQGRCPGINVAPARGLCLVAVDYPGEDDLAERNTQTAALRQPIKTPPTPQT